MRLLFVFAHPRDDSFAAAILTAACAGAQARDHETKVIDLYAMGFDPCLTAADHQNYASQIPPDLAPHIAALHWAEGLIFVYPTWWGAQPAILKGWLDRVWRPGVAFHNPTPKTPLRPALTNIRQIGVVTTLGAPWWHWTLLLGAPGRKMLLRGLRVCTARRTKTFWLALYQIDSTTPDQRRAFLAHVAARIGRV